jgi:hypothetical protein
MYARRAGRNHIVMPDRSAPGESRPGNDSAQEGHPRNPHSACWRCCSPLWGAPRLEALRFDMGARDGAVVGAVVALLIAATALAALVPGIPAAPAEPAEALRED